MEEFMLRKLTTDGRGTGEEKRWRAFLSLLKIFVFDPTHDNYQILENLVQHFDVSMLRMHGNEVQTERTKKELKERLEDIRQEKEDLYRAEVIGLQKLNRSKKLRTQTAECAQIVKKIKKLPTRKRTQKQLDTVNDELNELYVRQKKLENNIKSRRDCLSVMKNVFTKFDEFEEPRPPPSKRPKAALPAPPEPKEKEEKKERRHKPREEEHRPHHRGEDRRDRRSHRIPHASKRKYYESSRGYDAYRYYK